MWSYLDEENTSRAAEFVTDWSHLSKYCGIPEKVALPWFSLAESSYCLGLGKNASTTSLVQGHFSRMKPS